ncbi:MAG: DUF499 domain-containing protein, partial [Anaerolineae bacterium]|nr:DUF499 domain-containing protein [Anaerolineae bacterium]
MSAMKPWRNVVVPHRDIREGHFDESVFAASLSDAVNQRGPLEYHDAATFFAKTYPTRGLVQLLAAVTARLAGMGRGEGVIQIQTPFGGGKTHGLVALYHLFTASPVGDLVDQVLRESGVTAIPQARVVTFDGLAADPLHGRTPWGELASQLGRYALLEQHDRQRRAPGKELLHQLLGDAPTLILMDEIAEYAAKARDFQEQVMAFFQELSETAKVLPRCVLVATLPSSAPYGEAGERALAQLEMIFGRVEAIYTPVEGAEIYEVIRRRLFEDLGDLREAAIVAERYWQMYQQLGDDVPAVAREVAYRERMQRAYPFHPQLIDVLNERWSTFPSFQRTRGVLRLLAHVVGDLYRREHPAPLIQVAHLNLANPEIRREFLKHIGNEYEGVIAADIVDSNAKAQHLDHDLGSEYVRYGVASGLATAIFFGSFSGGERRGVNAPFLRLAILREGIPPAIVGDALSRLEDALWFLHEEAGFYQFRNQPNLNRVILEREEAVQDEDVAAELRSRLEKLAGTELRVILYPEAPGDIPDSRALQLAILSGAHTRRATDTPRFVHELLSKTSSAFRAYRNVLLVLTADEGELIGVRQQVRRMLALRSVQADHSLMKTLPEAERESLAGRLKEAESSIDWQLRLAYRHLARAAEAGEGVAWLDLGLPTTGERGSLAQRVKEYLKTQDILLDRLKPARVLEMSFAPDDQEKRLGDVYEAFLRYPHLPLLESEAVLYRAVAQGVRDGAMGVRIGERLAFKEPLAETLLHPDCVLVRPEVAEREKGVSTVGVTPAVPPEAPPVTPGGGEQPPSGTVREPPAGVRRLVLR